MGIIVEFMSFLTPPQTFRHVAALQARRRSRVSCHWLMTRCTRRERSSGWSWGTRGASRILADQWEL